ncbi:MAG: pectinesterase family protein [Eubacterium sp.]|nr:pectinesterase family protein [Eubacterium sp.]
MEAIDAGETIHMAEGTYEYSETILIEESNSGTADAKKSIIADGEVVIDFSGMGYTGSEADKANRGIILDGSYWYIKGITITEAADNGMLLSGDNNTLELCVFESNHDTGLQISRYQTGYDNISQWPSNNLIKNCTSFNNVDISGENADGFAAKLTCGEGNVFDGCMSYNNSDDGWDLYAKTATGPIGVVTLRNCIAFRNGKLTDGSGSAGGDMNGFKLGGSGVGTPHVVINCIAFENGAHGFTDNNNPTGITLVNCTSFNNSVFSGSNKANFQMNRENGGVNANLLSFNTTKIGSDGFIGTIENSVYYNNSPAYYHVSDKTAINKGDKLGEKVEVSASDFVSISAPSSTTIFHKEWRNSDGSINTGNFLKVADSSKLAKFATDGGKLGSRLADGVSMDEIPELSDKDVTDKGDAEKPSDGGEKPSIPVDGEEVAHNFTEDGLESDVFTISGNLSDSKGTVTYNGMTLTQCLKMESKTEIKFTAAADATLIMVFNEGETRNIKIDGEKKAINNGVLSVEVAAGDHTITKADSVNLYYIALVYPKTEEEKPELPEVDVIPSVDGKIDVWDLGAEQLDTEKYTNKLTADIINSWYPDVEAGTTGKNLATFQVTDKDGNVLFGFNDGGYPTTHRLRTTNTEVTRYDEKSLKNEAGEAAYTGYIYSNKGKTDTVYVEIALEAGDIVSFVVASNGTDSNLGFESPSGKVDDSYTHTLGSSTASVATYYAAETGLYKLYSLSEKLVVARAYVQHTQEINVVGYVDAPASLTNDYAVTFTCKETGVATKATVENGTYKAVLREGYTYEVSLDNADGYVVTSNVELTLEENAGGDDHYKQFNVTVGAVDLVELSGNVTGLSEEALKDVKISLEADNIYVPTVTVNADGSYSATVESNTEYKVVEEGIDDYQLVEPETIKVSEATNLDIVFEEKPVYKVTINPVGATLEDLSNATFIFTRHSDEDVTAEEDYVYTFTGPDAIALRNGLYTVTVKDSGDFAQKLTSNLKINGADVTKTIKFSSETPTSWDFTSDAYTGQTSFNGLTITGGSKHGAQYGMMIKNGTIEIPVSGAATIKVSVGYNWDIVFDENTEVFDNTNSGDTTLTYDYTGEAGTYTLKVGSQCTSYIKNIQVVKKSASVEKSHTWNFRSSDYTGQTDYDGLVIKNGKKHGDTYGMAIKNGSIQVPVAGNCTLTISVGYNWDITVGGTNYKDNTNSGDIDITYDYTGEAGTVEITVGNEFTSYIKQIAMVGESTGDAEDITVTVGATGCDYKTINDALDAVREMDREANQRAIIEIQPGDYEEMLVIDVPNVSLVNAKGTDASIKPINKGVDIEEDSVRITSYYGHGYTYYSMGSDCKYSDEILEVNKENGYPSFENPGSGTTNGSYWNATVVISASGFEAEGIIFENSFNQYVSKKAANDVIVAQSGAKEGSVKRADMEAGDTTVQNKKYVERAAALAMTNNVSEASFDHCSFIGRQDTLYGGTSTTAAFYDCDIYGGTDYIFGPMTAVFAKCNLVFNTMEDSNDVGYITAAQQKSGRGYLMYNCTITSTEPGVNTASEEVSKPGYLGRPWQANTSEVVFYATIIDPANDGTSLITPVGWNSTLSGTSDNVYEFGTYEMVEGIDNSASRATWAKTYASIENATLADGTAVSVEAFLGDWDAFADKNMDIVTPDGKIDAPETPGDDEPVEEKIFVFESKDLTAFAQGAKADGEEEKAGTENYFTVIYSAKSKVDGSSKTFEDGYASEQRLNLGGKATTEKNAVKFTTSNPSTVKIWWAEGGEDNRQIAILNASGEQVAVTADTVAKNAVCISKLELTEAGTYYLGGDINNNYLFKLEVTEQAPVVAEPFTMTLETSALAAVAQGTKTDGEEQKAGTDEYFTIIYSAKSKVDGSSKTFEDGYASAQRLNLGGKVSTEKNAVKFTTSNPSSVKVWWAEGGEDNRQIAILNASGEQVAVTTDTVAKNAVCISTLKLEEAGTYYLGGDINNNYLFKIEVTETPTGSSKPARADWATVNAPEINEVALNAENANEIVVTIDANIGYDGADAAVVTMTDKDGNVVATKKTSNEKAPQTVTFTPEASGTYTFEVRGIRENEEDKVSADTKEFTFSLPLTKPVIATATSIGGGSVEIVWNEVKEAEKYLVKATSTTLLIFKSTDTFETTDLSYIVEGLVVGKTYSFTVTAVRGEDVSEASDAAEVKVTEEAQRVWGFSAYGSSTNTANNGYEGSALDGEVTVYSENGKGKIVPGSTDGLAFYYAKMDPETENFTLTADIHVDNWTLSNGQEGFGLMVSDTVGPNGDATAFWNNSYQAIASKIEYYYDGEDVTTDTTAAKISMKLGIGSTAKLGTTAQDVADIKAGKITMSSTFTTVTDTLESSCGTLGAGTYNIIGNYTTEPTGNQKNSVTDLKLSIQRNNTGYILTYMDMEGNVIGSNKYYDLERTALTQIEEDAIYVGFFASRNARITATNIQLTTINPADDEPAEEREIEKVYPNYAITSATVSNTAEYDLVFRGNADGDLVIVDNNKKEVTNQHVDANKDIVIPTTLAYGNTTFTVTFTPDKDYVPGEYQELENYDAKTFTHTVIYKNFGEAGDTLYVSAKGTATGNGTKQRPLDIYTAVKYVQPGQTIVIMEGTYNLTKTVKVERGINGTADQMIYMIADPEASTRPVFDFGGRCAGMVLAGDYWYFKGFDVTKSADAQKGIQVSGNHNTLDQINAYMNGNTGIQISRLLGTDEFDQWPSYNLILNCTSYLNADKGYEDADGFAAKLTVGDGNVFDGCIAHHNADDGWDLFAKVQSGSIGKVVIKNSVAYKNGYVLTVDGKKYSELSFDGIETDAGNGNGFKMGGDSMSGHHELRNSIAFYNKAKGIDSNSCPDIEAYNCVSFDNESYNVAFYTNTAVNTDYAAEGVISYKKSNNVAEQFKFLGTQDATKVKNSTNFFFDGEKSVNTDGVEVQDDWFESLDFSEISRNADGTINTNGFLVLTENAKTGSSIGGTASEDVTPGEETDGSIKGNVVPSTGNDSSSSEDSSSDDSSDSSTTAAATQTSTIVVIPEMDTPLAQTPIFGGLESVNLNLTGTAKLQSDLIAKYRSRNMFLLAHLGNGVGFTINAGSMSADMKELNLETKKEVVANFAEGFDTVKLSPSVEGQLGFEIGIHANLGVEYAGKTAYIFKKSTLTGEYSLSLVATVNEIGNVAIQTNELSDIMILIAK